MVTQSLGRGGTCDTAVAMAEGCVPHISTLYPRRAQMEAHSPFFLGGSLSSDPIREQLIGSLGVSRPSVTRRGGSATHLRHHQSRKF